MADDATAYDGVIESTYEDSERRIFRLRVGGVSSVNGGILIVPASDLPSARVGDKVQVALFLRPEVADE